MCQEQIRPIEFVVKLEPLLKQIVPELKFNFKPVSNSEPDVSSFYAFIRLNQALVH